MGALTISTIQAQYDKDVVNYVGEMDTYLDFVVGGKHVKTSVAEDQGRDPDWDDTLTLPHTTGDEIKIRALTYRHLLPDKLIGEASLELSALQTDVATTATLLSKDGAAIVGEVVFTLSGGEPGSAQATAGAATGAAAGDTFAAAHHDPCAQASTAGYSGAGATAYPAKAAHKDLGGEHLRDLDPAATSPVTGTAGFGGSGATAYPALSSGKDLGGEHLRDFPESPNHRRDFSGTGGSKVTEGPFPSEGQTSTQKSTGVGLSEGGGGDYDKAAADLAGEGGGYRGRGHREGDADFGADEY